MDIRLLFISTSLLGLSFAHGTDIWDRPSPKEANRSHLRQRSLSLVDLPGSPVQTVPTEAVDWSLSHQGCRQLNITQKVSAEGCDPVQITNRMCYGVCANIHMPEVPGSQLLEMCTKCQPAGTRLKSTVSLKCIGGRSKTVTVFTVERCACSPCNSQAG